jgi:hypothetical protein
MKKPPRRAALDHAARRYSAARAYRLQSQCRYGPVSPKQPTLLRADAWFGSGPQRDMTCLILCDRKSMSLAQDVRLLGRLSEYGQQRPARYLRYRSSAQDS